ncbi:hypothetical protein KEM09_19510 [Carboxylicivirga mesophila]|uniref:Uncharacterized protein n=1 Tax=Carboxylicivirga mesophila TaxID=1166478 RepID=A0ABS5KF28_9BACT|nr:hypothetical protein [Carboxylicivirga mesophila]MBS2213605.1 hypothetical protein [Carboxylicivirga mesophila]
MEENKRLFSQKAIALATFFGGPAAAGYLIKKNYDAYGELSKGKNAFAIGVISTILLFSGIFSIPESIIDKIPNALIPAVYTGIIYLIVEKLQGHWLDEHKAADGEFYTMWRSAGIGVIFTLIILVGVGATAFIAGDLSQPDYNADYYNTEFNKFIKNENTALAIFEVIDVADPQYSIKELSKGVVLWQLNKEIITNLDTISNLPPEFILQNNKLKEYCDLRVSYNEVIIKAISEDTDLYNSEIDKIGSHINKVLEELN